MKLSRIILSTAVLALMSGAAATLSAKGVPSQVRMSKEVLKDKIKGGWAGQTIGCTYGGPTEFKYNGIIPAETPIYWRDHIVKSWFDRSPGLYDDVYMDLTFVEVFQKEGLDAPVESFAKAFANAPYPLWHANKQGRYNILHGVMPPASGHWENNPHADDIDFQIEADYAGLMAPGMVNAASFYSDAIGHMMNYGDGWYGGVYVAAMYSLAFVSSDVEYVVTEALKTIPSQSKFYKGMADVIKWYKQYPKNWETTWALFTSKYGYDTGCPDGVNSPFNIDAVINSGYIIIGLLYGQKDFYKTIDISTRCGQDSDCNPASSGGILGCMIGYSNIPEFWKKPLYEVEDVPFVYTDISVNKATDYSYDQALQVIERNGGKVEGDNVVIKTQKPQAVRYEKSFEGHYPLSKYDVKKSIGDVKDIRFTGNGIVVKGHLYKVPSYHERGYEAKLEVYLDGQLSTTMYVPSANNGGSAEIYYKYNIPEGDHVVTFKFLNKESDSNIVVDNYLVYTSDESKMRTDYAHR
ncbi:MAG: ADP-ribosylglycohydrolase family protein [Bacteroidales bacterium]|nr:ADP-ribosylglycohydrolase family protein [Bacteroidales bacterium]